MTDEQPGEGAPEQPSAPPPPEAASVSVSAKHDQNPTLPPAPGESMTESGYAYTVVDDAARKVRAPKPKRESTPARIAKPLLAVLIIVPAMVVGAIAWFVASSMDGDGGGNTRTNANVASTINAFSSGQGGRIQRYEGLLPPGLPTDIPSYPGAEVVSALAQVNGDDVVYLVVYDTPDSMDDVVSSYDSLLAADPWQIDGGQNARDSSLRQFTKIDDADIEGLVLMLQSKGSEVTTIFLSAQVTSGADDADLDEFSPPVSRTLPEDFPEDITRHPDAIIIETSFTREPQGTTYGISLITRDDVSSTIDFYRDAFTEQDWTVADADGSQSQLEGAEAISFENDDATLSGGVTAGEFTEDANYTRIDLVVRDTGEDEE